jgi:hypothetical protein
MPFKRIGWLENSVRDGVAQAEIRAAAQVLAQHRMDSSDCNLA